MIRILENVRQDLIRLVPSAFINDITCFVFYDNHPLDKKNIDITICTVNGEVKEIYQREIVSSTSLHTLAVPSEIKIMRNTKCDLFYVVLVNKEVIILSNKKGTTEICNRLSYVDDYFIDDEGCTGQPSLKVMQNNDRDPIIFDENLENLQETTSMLNYIQADDSIPIILHLKRKLVEAKYSVFHGENTFKNLLELHHLSAHSIYEKLHPNEDDSIFNKNFHEAAGSLKMKTETPWVKMCNNKIIIVFNLIVKTDVQVENINVLLHGSSESSLMYTTKLFDQLPTPPFWKEKEKNALQIGQESAVVVVIDLKEINCNLISRMDFSGVISCMKQGQEHLIPFEKISMSAFDIMGEQFDLLSSCQLDEPYAMLAVLATTEKIGLCFRLIECNIDNLHLSDLFCIHLKMEKVPNTTNVIIHKSSPHHVLNGVMIMFEDISLIDSIENKRNFSAFVYSRSSSQVLSLLHYIHDAVPCKIIVSSTNYKITPRTHYLTDYNEDIPVVIFPIVNYKDYATSILKRTAMILNYLDACITKMNESQIPIVKSKIGKEIDVFAGGLASFTDFKNNMDVEALRCNKLLKPEDVIPSIPSTESQNLPSTSHQS